MGGGSKTWPIRATVCGTSGFFHNLTPTRQSGDGFMGMRKWLAGFLHAAGDKLDEAHGRPTASPFRTGGAVENPNPRYNYPCGGLENCREKREKTMGERAKNIMTFSDKTMEKVESIAKRQNTTAEAVVAKGIQIEEWLIAQHDRGGLIYIDVNGRLRPFDFFKTAR